MVISLTEKNNFQNINLNLFNFKSDICVLSVISLIDQQPAKCNLFLMEIKNNNNHFQVLL